MNQPGRSGAVEIPHGLVGWYNAGMEDAVLTAFIIVLGIGLIGLFVLQRADMFRKHGLHVLPKKWEERFLNDGPGKPF